MRLLPIIRFRVCARGLRLQLMLSYYPLPNPLLPLRQEAEDRLQLTPAPLPTPCQHANTRLALTMARSSHAALCASYGVQGRRRTVGGGRSSRGRRGIECPQHQSARRIILEEHWRNTRGMKRRHSASRCVLCSRVLVGGGGRWTWLRFQTWHRIQRGAEMAGGNPEASSCILSGASSTCPWSVLSPCCAAAAAARATSLTSLTSAGAGWEAERAELLESSTELMLDASSANHHPFPSEGWCRPRRHVHTGAWKPAATSSTPLSPELV
jgi:hypothetical protein